MPLLSQSKFPRLWLLMQNTIGGNASKKELALRHYRDERRILEIGCSVGNIADAFLFKPVVNYLGIDIDDAALEVARRRFQRYRNFTFRNVSLSDLAKTGATFDYVMFAGILHHVGDAEGTALLADALKLVSPSGRLIISEPEALNDRDNRLFRLFYKLEQGQFLRSRQALERLVLESGAAIDHAEDHLVSPGIIKTPVARFNLITARPVGQATTHAGRLPRLASGDQLSP